MLMNLKGELIDYLDKSGFDDFTKIRYIYLYVCNLFSYDVRFIYGRQDLKNEIYNKKIDISNVDEFEIVCYTCAHVLVDILALFKINSEIVRESDGKFQHSYVVVKHQGKVLKLDPMKKHDTTRVKMNSPTLDFATLIDDPIFSDQLIEADKQILEQSNNKIDLSVLYNNKTIMELLKVIENNAIIRNITKEQLFFEKIQAIIALVNTRTDFYRYDDIDYYFSYLLKKFKMNDENIYVRPAVFFKRDDYKMKEIINIILVEYKNLPPVFYILEKVGKNFKIRDIEAKEVLEKLDEYSNWNVDYYFQTKASKAVTR